MADKLVLIDGHSILNRAFFGLPDLTNSKGVHTNAVLGFLNIMLKILDEEKPRYLTVAFDLSAPTFRHEMFDGYKGTRKPMAPELKQQVPLIKEMLAAMGVTIVTREGYEADDILGTLSRVGEKMGLNVVIVSGDRDLLQLATDKTLIRIPKTKKTGTEIENYYASDVKEKYQVSPLEFIDVKALMGDSSDNISGVPGIGEKGATGIISQFGSIEAAYANIDEVKPPKAREALREHYDMAELSKKLATIKLDCELDYNISDAKMCNLFTPEAYVLCKELEFKALINRFDKEASKGITARNDALMNPESDSLTNNTACSISEPEYIINEVAGGADMGEVREIFINQCKPTDVISFLIAIDGDEAIGAFLTKDDKNVYFIPHTKGEISELEAAILAAEGKSAGINSETILAFMREIIELDCRHITYGFKSQLKLLYPKGAPKYLRDKVDDLEIIEYLNNPIKNDYPYEDMANTYLGLIYPSREELINKKDAREALNTDKEKFITFFANQVTCAELLYKPMLEKLESAGMGELYTEIERPLLFVLADMELEGIYADRDKLKAYSDKLGSRILELEKEIYAEAGEEFNINSPKQLGVILFEKLGLPCSKKTKTGYSTAADVLESLAADYPVVDKILEYRQYSKLKSTYADGLPGCISNKDGRIHTTFNQTITATGRISSTEPNLQNIPIREELGREIRKVFLPKSGFVFTDADYSQIELRVLAHMSGDENLIDAYKQESDIHAITASQVFGVPLDEVTPQLRRNAKAVNFGIVYGISSFGLGRDLSISRSEAKEYIEKYFVTYPGIKAFLDGIVEAAKEQGITKTMYGRLRPVPEIHSSNFMQRQFGERIAMNSPIQGTAADIIKIAMIRVHDRLIDEKLESRLILQVHDELLIETRIEERDKVAAILEEEMTGAAKLAVNLEIDSHEGSDWYEAK